MALLYVSGFNMSIAQEKITELNEVEITAKSIEKFGVGSNISTIDSTVIKNYEQANLAQLLSEQSSVYIKQYGAGMLSSISFRGSGAGHTTFQWNGLQVGYPFLGQADLALIAIDFVDEINLVHGSASARYGTGAIGGIVDLQSNNSVVGFDITANQSFGSFGTINSTLEVSKGGEKGFVKIGGYYKESQNDFPYKSSSGMPLGNQENANYSLSGVQLSSALFIDKANSVELQLQSTIADRNLQSSIGSTSANNQVDKNIWSSFKYKHLLASGFTSIQYGFLYDQIYYNNSITKSEQHKGVATIEYDFSNSLSAELGIDATLIKVITPFYDSNYAQEIRANFYSSILWGPYPRLSMSLNLRQAFVTDYDVPFTPSLGLDLNAIQTNYWKMNIVGQLAKGYKVPTLNDRYWVPGGNLELQPEESVNAEIGFSVKNKSNTPAWLKVTSYKLWVDNWILWLPSGGIWSPENKRRVEGLGVEVETGVEKQLKSVKLKGWINYAYTKSTNQEALDEYDRSAGKQLPYVPFHNGNFTVEMSFDKWEFTANSVFTGKRFITSDNETEVPGYVLLNVRSSYKFRLKTWRVKAYLEVNNITNTNYQSIINKAMPGINFLVGAKFNFNKK